MKLSINSVHLLYKKGTWRKKGGLKMVHPFMRRQKRALYMTLTLGEEDHLQKRHYNSQKNLQKCTLDLKKIAETNKVQWSYEAL